jgi:hypothetical protein
MLDEKNELPADFNNELQKWAFEGKNNKNKKEKKEIEQNINFLFNLILQ